MAEWAAFKSTAAATVTLLTTLGSYFFAKMNMAIERTDVLRAQPITLQSAMNYALDNALLFAGEALIISLISEIFSGDNDDDDDEGSFIGDVAIETAKTMVAGLPVVRDAAGAQQGFDTGTYGAILKTFTNPVDQASQGNIDKALVKSTINLAGMLARIPSAQANRAVDAIWRQAEGEDVSPAECILGRQY